MDWFSRYVLSWRLANTLEAAFCLEALDEALAQGRPEIFNTDQGSQFTSREFTQRVEAAGVRMSMDGRGRCLDNIFIERLWRSLKYEDIYLNGYETVAEIRQGVDRYFNFITRIAFTRRWGMPSRSRSTGRLEGGFYIPAPTLPLGQDQKAHFEKDEPPLFTGTGYRVKPRSKKRKSMRKAPYFTPVSVQLTGTPHLPVTIPSPAPQAARELNGYPE